MTDYRRSSGSWPRRAGRWLAGAVLVGVAYYAIQALRDRRGAVGAVLATPGEPTLRTPIDVTPVVRAYVPLGTAEREAVATLERSGFSVEVFRPARYEWLQHACATCDRGAWGRYSQSFARGGQRIVVGIGFRRGRVAHLEARRAVRIIEVP